MLISWLKEPSTAEAWTNKHKGKAEEAAYKKIFRGKEEGEPLSQAGMVFGSYILTLQPSAELATSYFDNFYWRRILKTVQRRDCFVWGYRYFETNPQRLAVLLHALLQDIRPHGERFSSDALNRD